MTKDKKNEHQTDKGKQQSGMSKDRQRGPGMSDERKKGHEMGAQEGKRDRLALDEQGAEGNRDFEESMGKPRHNMKNLETEEQQMREEQAEARIDAASESKRTR